MNRKNIKPTYKSYVERIKKLNALWMRCITGHHKDKDCHFYIEIDFKYGENPVYIASHYGYVISEWREHFSNFQSALEGLQTRIRLQIENYCYERASDNPENEEYLPTKYWQDILDDLRNIK